MQKEKIKSIAKCVLAVLGVAGVLTIVAVAPNSVQKKWDDKWRIVGFDIPEKKKQAREALRNKMRELGFINKGLFVATLSLFLLSPNC